MTLACFCAYDTHLKKNFLKPVSRDYYSYNDVIMHSDTAENGNMWLYFTLLNFLQGGNMWLWPSQKRSKRLDLLFGFTVLVRQWLEQERLYLAEWQIWGSRCSLCFSADLDLLLPLCMTHLTNRLRPPSTYTAVVCLRTTAEFLVEF